MRYAAAGACGRRGGAVPDRTELERIFAAVAAASLDSIILFDERGRILELNSAAEQMFGHRRDEVMGGPVAELIAPSPLRDALAAVVEGTGATFVGKRV